MVFELNNAITSFPNMDLLVSLKSFSFTNSFYTINDNNSNFYFTFDNITVHEYSISHSNYSIDQLITYLNILFVAYFIFTFNLQTLKITITSSTGTPFRLVSTNVNNNIYEVLGFDDIIPYSTLSTVYTSPYLFNMMGVQVLHICLPNLSLDSVGLANTIKYNIIDSVQVISTSGETQTHFNDNNFQYKISDDVISSITVMIYDQDFQPVNFNNIDWFMQLTFCHMYKKPFIASEYLHSNNSDANQSLLLFEKQQLLNNLI
jgi:hypothetical protein